MVKYRVGLAGMVALLAACIGGAVFADDKTGGDKSGGDKSGAGTASARKYYTGKIASVDTDKRTLVLGDFIGGTGTGTGGTGTGGKGTGTGTGGTGTGTGTGDKGTTGTGSNRKMTFTLSEKATITLDGKDATMRDLKAGLYARVHPDRKGTTGGSGDKSTTGGTGRDTGRDTGGTGTAGQSMTTSKVEAFTKAPRGDSTTDRKGGDR